MTPKRTFSERHRCTLSEASRCACVAFQTKEAADSLAGVDVPVWFPMKKRARRQRLSVRVGAMVAELSF
jgi:hypothetical protein